MYGKIQKNEVRKTLRDFEKIKDIKDDNGIPFVAVNGDIDLGIIPEETGLTEAPIRLSEGVQYEDGRGYGLKHIELRHGEEIRNAGFSSIEQFVSNVANNYTVIRKGEVRAKGKEIPVSNTYLLEVKDKHNNTLFIELSKNGDY